MKRLLIAILCLISLSSAQAKELFGQQLQPGEIISRLGSIYVFLDYLGSSKLRVQNIFSQQEYEIPNNSIFVQQYEYNGVSIGDEAIMLSNNMVRGEVFKLFGDGSAILKDLKTGTYIIGNRPKTRLYPAPDFYHEDDLIIDSHNFKGKVIGAYQENFLLYSYQSHKMVSNTNVLFTDNKHTALILHPPFKKKHFRNWIIGLAREHNRGVYIYRGNSNAQFVMSHKIYKSKFAPELLRIFNYMSSDEFYQLVKPLLWQDQDPKAKAERLRQQIHQTIANSI